MAHAGGDGDLGDQDDIDRSLFHARPVWQSADVGGHRGRRALDRYTPHADNERLPDERTGLAERWELRSLPLQLSGLALIIAPDWFEPIHDPRRETTRN